MMIFKIIHHILIFCSPVMLRKFDSGVMVIQSKSYSDDEVSYFVLIIEKL